MTHEKKTSNKNADHWGETFGGKGGTFFMGTGGRRISTIRRINGGSLIEGIGIFSSDKMVKAIELKTHGEKTDKDGEWQQLILEKHEFVTSVQMMSHDIVEKVKFLANVGNSVEGGKNDKSKCDKLFEFESGGPNSVLLNISGRSSDCINQLTFYWGPIRLVTIYVCCVVCLCFDLFLILCLSVVVWCSEKVTPC